MLMFTGRLHSVEDKNILKRAEKFARIFGIGICLEKVRRRPTRVSFGIIVRKKCEIAKNFLNF